MRVPRVAGVRTSSTLGRYSSAIRAACANERSCGSARGAISNGRPYRDLIFRLLTDGPDATRTESSRNLSEMAWFQQLLFARQFDCRVRLSDRERCLPSKSGLTRPWEVKTMATRTRFAALLLIFAILPSR